MKVGSDTFCDPFILKILQNYSHLFNKRGGGAKVAKSLNVEVGINVEGGIFLEKTMKAGKSAIQPWLSCPYNEHTPVDLPSSVVQEYKVNFLRYLSYLYLSAMHKMHI